MADSLQMNFVDPQSSDVLSLKASNIRTLQQVADLKAANVAEYQNFGTLLTPQFEKEILDIARRRAVFGQLLDAQQRPAVNHPHRYFDQVIIPNNQGFSDPRTIAVTAANNGATLRTEFSAFVRASTGQINFGLFDQQTAAQSSVFPQLVAKDLADMIQGLYQLQDKALFTGTALNLTDGASTQYASIATQVTNTIQVNPGVSIIDSIRTKIAQMMADPAVQVRPTHIFLNPLLVDLIELEIKNAPTTMRNTSAGLVEIIPGLHVMQITTVAGVLPIIPCWEMATRVSTVSGASTDYPIFVATMDMIERAYIGSPLVQLYKLGLVTDLADKYVAVRFDTGAIIRQGAKAHAYGYVSR